MKKILVIITAALTVCLCGCSYVSDYVTDWIDTQREKIFPREQQTAGEESPRVTPNAINTGVFDLDTFNPLVTRSQSVREAMQLVYEPLYMLDTSLRPVPVLAESCVKSEDGRYLTLNIKQGVTWHDGSALTSTDVAYTFRMIREGRTTYTEQLKHVSDYRMTDDYSIAITLDEPTPAFEAMLTFPIVKYQTDMNANPSYVPNGTGPFCYGTRTSVDEFYFGAFGAYHGGRAAIDAMYLRVADSYEKYMTMLEASEIDFSSSEIVDLTEYMPKGSLSLNDYPENKMVFLGFNMADGELSGALTRQGISEAIDREEIVDSVIFSRGTASKIPINPASYLYFDDGTGTESDELKANDDFSSDGWSPDEDGRLAREVNGSRQSLSVEILTNADNGEHVSVADSVAAMLNRIGVRAEVVKLPYESYVSRVSSGNYDVFIGEIEIAGNMELTPLISSSGNYFAYNNPELATISAQMGMASGEDELKALFRQYAEVITNDMPFAVIYYKKGSLITSANVKSGIEPSYSWLYRNCASWRVTE